MFGYIQPLKCELKVKEYDYYRAAYCGLCNALKKNYGFRARFIVNYDFAFVALLLSSADGEEDTVLKKRCIACPRGRKCIQSDKYDIAASVSVILMYLKLCDDVDDSGFFRGIFKARAPRLLLRGAYKKAVKRNGAYAEKARKLYDELNSLEKAQSPSIDETADKFARMLTEIVEGEGAKERILREILYHIGRFVYIIDALDDVSGDFQKKEYNPIIYRFDLTAETLPEDVETAVVTTLEDSRQAILRAFDLLCPEKSENLLRNIIELGMLASISRVLNKGEKEDERSL